MARINIIGMEDLEEIQPINPAVEVSEASILLLEAEAEQSVAENLNDASEEGIEIVGVIQSMAASAPEHAVEIATEHLLRKLNQSNKGISLENFNEHSAALNTALETNLTIAQEGILSRLGNTIKLFFTAEEKIHEEAITTLQKMKTNGCSETTIVEPGWGRSFSRIAKPVISAADAFKTLHDYNKNVTSSSFSELIKEYTLFVESITEQISRSRFIANDDAIAKIQDMNKDAAEIGFKADKIIDSADKIAKNDPSFKPMTLEEATKLSKEVQSVLSNNSLKTLEKRFQEAINNANMALWLESNTRLIGMQASDIRAARALITKVNPALIDIIDILKRRNRLCFACVNYIKASIAK